MTTVKWIEPEAGASDATAGVGIPEPCCLVIFGATGDLASRKLFPSVHGLWSKGLLPRQCALVGVGRRPKDDAAFRADVKKSLVNAGAPADGTDGFLERVFYQP